MYFREYSRIDVHTLCIVLPRREELDRVRVSTRTRIRLVQVYLMFAILIQQLLDLQSL